MSICKETPQIQKFGCKKEDLTSNPPILRTNEVPDENGVTHHEPSLCQDVEIIEKVENPKKKNEVGFKNRLVVNSLNHLNDLEDKLRLQMGYLWNTRTNEKSENDLYYVWTEGDLNDSNLKFRKIQNVQIYNDKPSNSSYGARTSKIRIIGQKLHGLKDLGNGQRVSLKPPSDVRINRLTGFELFEDFEKRIKDSTVLQKKFIDYNFTTFIPFDDSDFEKFTILDNGNYTARVQSRYNFFVENFENLTKNSNISERILPSSNVWFSEIFNRQKDVNDQSLSVERFFDLINLNGKILTKKNVDVIPYPRKSAHSVQRIQWKEFDPTQTEEFQYFSEWANSYKNLTNLESSNIEKLYRNQIITFKDLEDFQGIADKSLLFPMNFYFEFPNQNIIFKNSQFKISQPILESLNSSNFDVPLMIHTLKHFPENEKVDFQDAKLEKSKDLLGGTVGISESLKVFDKFSTNFDNFTNLSYKENVLEEEVFSLKKFKELNVNVRTLNIWDFSKWLDLFNQFETSNELLENSNVLDVFKEVIESQDFTFLGSYHLELKKTNYSGYKLFQSLMLLILFGRLKKILKIRKDGGFFRTLEEMFEFGSNAHSEQLFYKIQKISTETGEIVQNFYFPNSNIRNVIKFADSQVKYGKEYTYRVFVYNAVLATEYKYNNLQIFSNDKKVKSAISLNSYEFGTPVADLEVEYFPKILIVEQEYFEFTGKMLDYPPVIPEVEFINFISVDDKIMINMRSNSGQNLEKQIRFSDLEEIFQPLEDDKVLFKNDDPIKSFEVFKIENEPKSIYDFKDFGRTFTNKNNAPSFSLIENIEKNKKYYYTFRSIDKHGHKSNPSSIYELELVEDFGFLYLDVKVYKFPIFEKFENEKSFKQIFKLSPNFQQIQIDYKNSQNFNIANSAYDIIPKVGILKDSVFGKNYKIRITSNNTGKKIDLNFKILTRTEK